MDLVLLAVFANEPAAELVDARRHDLEALVALGEDGLEGPDLLLECVEAGHYNNTLCIVIITPAPPVSRKAHAHWPASS